MAEVEPAADEVIEAYEKEAKEMFPFSIVVGAGTTLAILARLRKAETDNANMAKLLSGYHQICSEAGIAPASSEIYAAAERLTERAKKAERERDEANRQLAAARESFEAVKDFAASNFDLSCVVLSAIADIDEHVRATQGGENG